MYRAGSTHSLFLADLHSTSPALIQNIPTPRTRSKTMTSLSSPTPPSTHDSYTSVIPHLLSQPSLPSRGHQASIAYRYGRTRNTPETRVRGPCGENLRKHASETQRPHVYLDCDLRGNNVEEGRRHPRWVGGSLGRCYARHWVTLGVSRHGTMGSCPRVVICGEIRKYMSL